MNETVGLKEDDPLIPRIDLLITDKCNMKCPLCYAPSPCNLELSCESVLRIANTFRNLFGTSIIVISGGEPTLHSQFTDVLRSLKNEGFEIFLHTNGKAINHLLSVIRQTVSKIVLPLDGPDSYIHGLHRRDPAHFTTILEFLRSLDLVSGQIQIGSVLTSKNQHHVNDLIKLVYETNLFRKERQLTPLSLRLYQFRPDCRNTVNNDLFFLSEKAFNIVAHKIVRENRYRETISHICGYHLEDSKCLLVFPNGDLRITQGPSTTRICNLFDCSDEELKRSLSYYRVDTRPHSLTNEFAGGKP